MFQSYEYIKYSPETKEYQYKIVDDEGWEVMALMGLEAVAAELSAAAAVVAVAKVYTKKGKSIEEIGMNIALLVLYCSNKYNSTSKQECEWQDIYCSKYIDNWEEIKTHRDKHLQLLQLFQ